MSFALNGQQLLSPSDRFSKKKTSYFTLNDGTELTGTIKDLDKKKGLIESIKIKDGAGKKHKLKPKDIKYMYLPPTGLDNLGKALDFVYDAQKWNDEKLNQDFLKQGYVYFENADVKVKKKNEKLLMQLLNPGFSKHVKVYHDPRAKESIGLGVGKLTVAGDNDKSYYISKDNAPAFRLKKKNYGKEFEPLWNSCSKIMEDSNKRWGNFVNHIIAYSECAE